MRLFVAHYSAVVAGLLAAAFLALIFSRVVGLGHDECGIILTSLNLDRWFSFASNDLRHLGAAFISYSRGGLNIFWAWLVYKLASAFGAPLTSVVLVLPSALLICAAGVVLFRFVTAVSRSKASGLVGMLLFLTATGIVGYARTMPIHASMILFLKSLLFLMVFRAEELDSRRRRVWCLVISTLLVFADNSYVVAAAQTAVLAFAMTLARSSNRNVVYVLGQVLRNYLTSWLVLFPCSAIVLQVLVYKFNINGGGMLFHNLHEVQAGLHLHKDFLSAVPIQLGLGTAILIVPSCLLLIWASFRRESPVLIAAYRFTLIWCGLQTFFVFLRDWGNSTSYVPLVAAPYAVVIALACSECCKVVRAAPVGFSAVALLNLIGVFEFLFGPLGAQTRAYGEPVVHDVANNYKAAGAIFRRLGYKPEEEEKIPAAERSVAVPDGEALFDKPIFVPLFYFGTSPRNAVTRFTRYVVESDHPYRPIFVGSASAVQSRYASLGFCLAYVVEDHGRDVIRIYGRECDVRSPVRYEKAALMSEFDARYANFESLKTVDWLIP